MGEKFYRIIPRGEKKVVAEVSAFSDEQALYKHAINETAKQVKDKTKAEKRKIVGSMYSAIRSTMKAIASVDPNQKSFLKE